MSRLYFADGGGRVWSPERRAYKCDWCGRVGRWSGSWQAYGSILDEEDGNEHHLCSSDCAAKWSVLKSVDATGRIPPRGIFVGRDGQEVSR